MCVHRIDGRLPWQLSSYLSAMQHFSVRMLPLILILSAAASLLCRSSWIDTYPTSVGFPSWSLGWQR